jgi:hypothetical protein
MGKKGNCRSCSAFIHFLGGGDLIRFWLHSANVFLPRIPDGLDVVGIEVSHDFLAHGFKVLPSARINPMI